MLEKLLGQKRNWPIIGKRYAWKCVVFSLCLIIILGGCRLQEAIRQQTPTASYKTFTDWCTNKAKLIPEARLTVDTLLKKAETNECKPANQKLSSLDDLNLTNNKISDITPLTSLTQLTNLDLSVNQISNITPLTSLTQLTNLDLDYNEISDITLLKSLTNLTYIWLGSNKISDITPLTSLTKLTEIYLPSNKISNITPLTSLTNTNFLKSCYI